MEKFAKDYEKTIYEDIGTDNIRTPFMSDMTINLQRDNMFISKDISMIRDHILDLQKLQSILDSIQK